MAKLFMMDFPADKIALTRCYADVASLEEIKKASPAMDTLAKIEQVMGDLVFPPSPLDRPYTFSSIVLSSDGKMAFDDEPSGPMIAKNNYLDPYGALADFWVLNALRSTSDAIILGARTLQNEPNNTSHIFDPELVAQRKALYGKVPHPVNIVVSFDGRDIPLDHVIFNIDGDEEYPVAVATSPEGASYVTKHLKRETALIDPSSSGHGAGQAFAAALARGAVPVVATGRGSAPDAESFLRFLKDAGTERLLIESPSYTNHLLSKGMLDEYFINYSMLFAGGTFTPGTGNAFASTVHPHARLLSLGVHGSSFMYTRQKLYYGIDKTVDLSAYKY